MRLIPRQNKGCVKCDDTSKLECPSCPTGQSCQFSVPVDCTQCPKSFCLKDASSGGKDKASGPSAGPIAGGVIGGIAAIAILTFLVWKYVIRPKRSDIRRTVYEAEANPARDVEKDTASRITRRSSTHTVHSIASTVLTRASNIIQIAYIPGVTNRATPTSPTVLVPPVPPIPMHHTEGNRESTQDDQHFFVPGNLRDSTYSGISGFSDRTSYAPRSSIASTIYGKQAQVLTPAQTGMRAKPTVVSVKSGSSGSSTPPVPSINLEKYQERPKSTASNFSVGSTFLSNANTASQARAQVVKVGSGLRKVEIAYKPEANVSSTTLSVPPYSPGQSSMTRDSNAVTLIDESPAVDQGPFSDPPGRASQQSSLPSPTLIALAETEPESRPVSKPDSIDRGRSPFGDHHATKE